MQFPTSLARAFSLRSNASNEYGMGLDDLNASPGQSNRSRRIMQEIRDGSLICTICTDPVELGHNALNNLWHCKECYNVYHYRCIKSWEHQSMERRVFFWRGIPSWKCPTCSAPQTTIRGPMCWCGKQDHMLCGVESPNACGYVCGKAGKCGHGKDRSCSENCHPGPCQFPCTARCPPGPICPPKPPTVWDRFCRRAHERKKGSFRLMALGWALIAVIYGLLGVLLLFYIRWKVMPYRYPEVNTYLASAGILMGLLIVVHPVAGFILFGLFRGTDEFLEAALNLRAVGGQRRCKRVIGFVIFLALAAFFGCIWFLPTIVFFEGPIKAWRHQMKDSCNGLNVRISMDGYPGVPATKFDERYDLGNSTEDIEESWYLAQHLKPTAKLSNAPFQFYTRLSGSFASRYFAVDVDVQHNAWRLYEQTEYDQVNEWLAYDKDIGWRSEIPFLPTFPLVNETLLSNGTFSQATMLDQQMKIPELDMVITNMYRFLNEPKYEPFLRVFNFRGFNTSMKAEDQGEKEPADLWSSKPHDREVLRMAAFGPGRRYLTMCAREYVGYRNGKPVPSKEKGIHQAELVPFAIIAAMRQRYTETGMRAKWTPSGPSGCYR